MNYLREDELWIVSSGRFESKSTEHVEKTSKDIETHLLYLASDLSIFPCDAVRRIDGVTVKIPHVPFFQEDT
jgi:hypothetical protein